MNGIVKARIELALLFLLFIFILPRQYFVWDFEFWTNWALQIHRHGLTGIYDHPTTDYHPLYFYVIWLYDLVQGNEQNIIANINYLKLFTLPFDFLPAIVLCCFRQNIIKVPIPYMFLMLNIAYMFNTMVWGQVDAIHTNLLFLSVLAAFYRPAASGILFALALAIKPHAIIFIPILGIIWLFTFKNIGTWVKVFGMIAVTLLIVVLPFIITGNAGKMMNVVGGAVGRYPYVSVCAFNIWYLITTINPEHTIDSETYILFRYKHWGLLMFFVASALVLVPFLFSMWRARINNEEFFKDKGAQVMLACGLIVLYFFYFNTQMHERYAHGIIIFFFFYGVFSKNYKLYILASIPYLLSLDKVFPDFLPVKHYKIIWASKVIAIWYTLTVAYASWLYIREHRISREYRQLKEAWLKK